MAKFRILVAGLAFLVTLGVLVAGWSLYRTYGVIRPLERQLAQISGVERVSVSLEGKSALVTVSLGAVDDLKETYRAIQRVVLPKLGELAVIELQSRSSPPLDRWWDEQQPLLYEDLEKYNFRDLVRALQTSAAERQFQCRVTMDAYHIYVQVSHEGAFLYQVLPYRAFSTMLPGAVEQRG